MYVDNLKEPYACDSEVEQYGLTRHINSSERVRSFDLTRKKPDEIQQLGVDRDKTRAKLVVP